MMTSEWKHDREDEDALKRRPVLLFLLVLALIFVRYCYYGFHYFYQLDDYIQYHNYTAYGGSPFQVILKMGMLAARPLAGCADVLLWSHFFPIMIVGLALISAMYAASACLFRSVWAHHFGTGWIFLVVYALLPLGFEGTYWMSAATRIVTGLFFASLALFFFEKWCRDGKKWALVLYVVCQLFAYGFYEQVLIFSVTSVLLLAALNVGKKRLRPLWGLFSFVNAAFYFVFTSIFKGSALYSGRTQLVPPTGNYYWHTFFPDVLEQVKSAFLAGGFYTFAKGFKRGVTIMASDRNIVYLTAIFALCALLFAFSSRAENNGKKPAAALICGLLMAVAPVTVFFVLDNSWFSLRSTVTSFCGIALMADALFALIFRRAGSRRAITAWLVTIFAFVCCIAAVSELHDYRETTLRDTDVTSLLVDKLEADGNLRSGLKVGILNLEASYLGNQNYYFHEHIHGVTESWWALTGALQCRAGKDVPTVTPMPANPAYQPWNCLTSRPDSFDAVYLYKDGELIRTLVEGGGTGPWELYSDEGRYLGCVWEEDSYGYLKLNG